MAPLEKNLQAVQPANKTQLPEGTVHVNKGWDLFLQKARNRNYQCLNYRKVAKGNIVFVSLHNLNG